MAVNLTLSLPKMNLNKPINFWILNCPTKSKGVTTQMNALDEYFPMVVFTFLPNTVHVFALEWFCFSLLFRMWLCSYNNFPSLSGGHILSGACIETHALDELIPDWKEKGVHYTVFYVVFSIFVHISYLLIKVVFCIRLLLLLQSKRTSLPSWQKREGSLCQSCLVSPTQINCIC